MVEGRNFLVGGRTRHCGRDSARGSGKGLLNNNLYKS
jgi:hypothetical protein